MSAKSLLKTVIATSFVFLYLSCGQDGSLGIKDSEFVYPIRVGNQWEYQRTVTFHPDIFYT